MKKLVYVASPYSGLCPSEALELAVQASREVKEAGGIPVNPILCFDGVYDECCERDEVLEAGLELLKCCDCIYVNKVNGYWEDSEGIKEELAEAKRKGLKEVVRFTTLVYKDR